MISPPNSDKIVMWRFFRNRRLILRWAHRAIVPAIAWHLVYEVIVFVTLVLSCTVSEILQVFVLLTSPLFHPNLGGLPVDQIARVGVSPSRSLKLFGCEIIFEVFQPVWKTTSQTDRQTDRQTTYSRITALCIALRGKNETCHILVPNKLKNVELLI